MDRPMQRRSFLGLLSFALFGLAGLRPSGAAEPVILSFVHPTGRIDVRRSEVVSMKAYDHTEFYVPETGKRWRTDDFGVTLCFSERVRKELKTLTANLVDEELDVMSGCEVIVSPVIREPLGNDPCFSITAFDREELEQLIAKLENASGKGCNGMS